MKRMRKIPTVAIIAPIFFTLAGCNTMSGPKRIVTSEGPVDQRPTRGIYKQFIDSESAAFSAPSDEAKANKMLADGLSLIYVSCSDFFWSAGTTQKWVIVSRDSVGALGTLATSVLTLHERSKNAVSNVALGTAAAFTGLDIYAKNFLFSAENIESVRTLVTNALTVHSSAALTSGSQTYRSAMGHLEDNQNICSSMQMTSLVRDAIMKGTVKATTAEGSGISKATQLQDERVFQRLGALLNPPGTLSKQQTGMLWWLFRDTSSAAQKKDVIFPALSGLPSESIPLDATGKFLDSWKFSDQVRSLLDQLSDLTKKSFQASIAAANTQVSKPIIASGNESGESNTVVVSPIFLNQDSGSKGVSHIQIGIE